MTRRFWRSSRTRTVFAPTSIMPRRRRHRSPPRETEPRFGIATAELTGSQLHDLQRRLDREGDFACRTTRWTDLSRRTFSAADQAQPQAARFQYGSDLCRELLSLTLFIEHMKTTAVEHELERSARRWRGEKVPYGKAAAQSASLHCSGPFIKYMFASCRSKKSNSATQSKPCPPRLSLSAPMAIAPP